MYKTADMYSEGLGTAQQTNPNDEEVKAADSTNDVQPVISSAERKKVYGGIIALLLAAIFFHVI